MEEEIKEIRETTNKVLDGIRESIAGNDEKAQKILEDISPELFTNVMGALIVELSYVASSAGCPIDILFGYVAQGVKKATGLEIGFEMRAPEVQEETQH